MSATPQGRQCPLSVSAQVAKDLRGLSASSGDFGSTGSLGLPAHLISAICSARNHMRTAGSSTCRTIDSRPLACEANAAAWGYSFAKESVTNSSAFAARRIQPGSKLAHPCCRRDVPGAGDGSFPANGYAVRRNDRLQLRAQVEKGGAGVVGRPKGAQHLVARRTQLVGNTMDIGFLPDSDLLREDLAHMSAGLLRFIRHESSPCCCGRRSGPTIHHAAATTPTWRRPRSCSGGSGYEPVRRCARCNGSCRAAGLWSGRAQGGGVPACSPRSG